MGVEIEEKESKTEKIVTIILFALGISCLIAGFTLTKLDPVFLEIEWADFADPAFYSSYSFIAFLLFSIGYLPLLIKTVLSCVEEMREGEIFNEFLLMIIATVGAYCINEYPESLFVLLFSIIGEFLEDYATDKSKKSIEKLVNEMPLYAHLFVDGEVIERDPSELKIGDVIKILPGEKVPVDGFIIQGNSSFDLSSINGESLPKDVKEGDKIYSGSINLNSVILLKVEKEFKDSTLSQILDLVRNEQDKKAKAETFINKFAKVYTPIVIFLALLVFLIGFGVSGFDFQNGGREWLYNALSVLLVACPCSLVVSIPITFFSAIGSASKFGVLIKGSHSIEELAKSKVFAFDKTGTVTTGKFKLCEGYNADELYIAASLESNSTHPLASALKEAYTGELEEVTDFLNVPGKGVEGRIKEEKYFLGNKAYLEENGIEFESRENVFKTLYLGSDKRGFICEFVLRDQVKDGVKLAVDSLKKQGVEKTYIISGDDEKIVKEVARENGMDYYAEKLPDEKLNLIKEMQRERKVAFVGDGINDSPSLLVADCGIAMGGLGSDAAIESADIVIMDDDVKKVAQGQHLAKKTMSVLKLGVAISVFFKLLVMALDISGVMGSYAMIVSSFSDTGILLICVLNALRMLFYKPKPLAPLQ